MTMDLFERSKDLAKKDIEHINSLDSLVFPNESEKKFLKEWLEINDLIEAKFITREEYNSRKWNILVETKDNGPNKPKSHNLYLPTDLKVWELPAIILRINKISFKWETLPEYASSEEVKRYIWSTISHLINRIKELWNNKKAVHKFNKAIIKYIKLFELTYSWEYWGNYNKRTKVDSLDKTQDFRRRISRLKSEVEESQLHDKELLEIEEQLAEHLDDHLKESIFERWVRTLADFMMIFSQEDWYNYCGRIWKLVERKNVLLKMKQEERMLRELVKMDELKKDLQKIWHSCIFITIHSILILME